jgi:hypothetical protein
VITRRLDAAEVLYELSTMNDKSSFVKDPLVITKQLNFNNSSKIPTSGSEKESPNQQRNCDLAQSMKERKKEYYSSNIEKIICTSVHVKKKQKHQIIITELRQQFSHILGYFVIIHNQNNIYFLHHQLLDIPNNHSISTVSLYCITCY